MTDPARQAFALFREGRRDAGVRLCEALARERPDHLPAWHILGVMRLELGALTAALEALERALALAPAHPGVLASRAVALVALGRHEDGLAAGREALAVDPDNAAVLNVLGVALRRLGRPAEALAAYDRALAVRPGHADALCNRGAALFDLGRPGEALAAHDRACAALPERAEAFANRAAVLVVLGRPVEAAADYGRVLALAPDHPYALGGLLHARRQVCDWRDDAALEAGVRAGLAADRPVITPFAALSVVDDPALHQACARLWSKAAAPAGPPPAWPPRPPGERLRVAYLSADLHDHATGRLMVGVLERHDRARFEILALSYGPDRPGPLTDRLDAAVERRIDLRGLSDAEAAALARGLGVDIVVDLKGHTQDGRPGILAARAAPVQISWLGYPGTLGAPYVDYVLADPVILPAAAEPYYDEAILRLPGGYQPNDLLGPDPAPLNRARAGLPPDAFVFCCFNNPYKITPAVFALWMDLLKAVPKAVLWLYDGNPGVVDNLRRAAAAAGVDAARLVFAGPAPHAEHLARHRLADLVLDTWPYGAHTTASDALRMGVPLLTLPGESFASRVGASLLTALGLAELVATDTDAYVAMAVRLAKSHAETDGLKRRLALAVATSAVFDPGRFVGGLETAFETLSDRHRASPARGGPDLA